MTLLALDGVVEQVLGALLVFSAAIWIGGFIAIMVVNASANAVLSSADRTALFRNLGRRYLTVAMAAALVIAASGGLLLAGTPFDAITISILVLVGVLVAATIAGVVQARRMTRLRHKAGEANDPAGFAAALKHGSVSARILRTLIGLSSLALFVLAFVRL